MQSKKIKKICGLVLTVTLIAGNAFSANAAGLKNGISGMNVVYDTAVANVSANQENVLSQTATSVTIGMKSSTPAGLFITSDMSRDYTTVGHAGTMSVVNGYAQYTITKKPVMEGAGFTNKDLAIGDQFKYWIQIDGKMNGPYTYTHVLASDEQETSKEEESSSSSQESDPTETTAPSAGSNVQEHIKAQAADGSSVTLGNGKAGVFFATSDLTRQKPEGDGGPTLAGYTLPNTGYEVKFMPNEQGQLEGAGLSALKPGDQFIYFFLTDGEMQGPYLYTNGTASSGGDGTGNTGSDETTAAGGSGSGSGTGDLGGWDGVTIPTVTSDAYKPQIDESLQSDDSFVYFTLTNNTKGKFADNQVFITILGRKWNDDPLQPFSYLTADGQLPLVSTRVNDKFKWVYNPWSGLVDTKREFTNLGFTIADLKALGQIDKNGNAYVKVPAIRSGRMYVSYGEDICVEIKGGDFAGPALENPTDPNQDIIFDFVEFTINDIGQFWGNTTRVDGYVFPINIRLTGTDDVLDEDGNVVYENGVALQQPIDKWAGDLGTLEEIFAKWDYDTREGTLFEKFNHLLVRNREGKAVRISAPGKGEFDSDGDEPGQYADYFDEYVNYVWNMYTNPFNPSNPLVFTTQAGRFVQTGTATGAPGCNADSYGLKDGSLLMEFRHEVWDKKTNSWVEANPGRRYYIHKPNTGEVFEGKGAFDHHHEQGYGEKNDLVIESQLCAAFNRGVAHLNEDINKVYSTNPNDPEGIYSNGNPVAPWGNTANYYVVDDVNKGVFNFYAMFWHLYGVDGKAYGYCYDDVWEQSTLLYARHANVLAIDFYSYGGIPSDAEKDPEPPVETEAPSEEETEAPTEPVIVTPVKVTGVQAQAGDGQITLTWNDCGAESYIVRRMTTGMKAYEVLTDAATAAGWVDTNNVVTNKEYYYRVYGCFRDAEGNLKEGPASDLVTVSLGNPPKKTTGVQAVYTDGKITLNWDDVGAEKYKITRYDDTRKTYVNLTFNAKAANGFEDSDIIEAERYCYRISGYFRDADGKLVSGELSDTIWVVATNKEPAKVTGVSAAVTNGAVTLTWDAADGARFYKISRAAGESGSSYETRMYALTDTTYTDKVITAGTYRYKVVGYYIEPGGSWHYGTMSNTLMVTVK